MRWAFFIDANLEPKVATILDNKGYRAEYSDYVLTEDADDEDDILPYVCQEELVVITADVEKLRCLRRVTSRRGLLPRQAAHISLQNSHRRPRSHRQYQYFSIVAQ